MLPRAIDIDILLYDGLVLESADLRIPHSRLRVRRFVLEPLLEIAPDTIDPKTRKPLRDFLENVSSQSVRKVTGGD
jgi:2-amino-4-hydroxy-6-hydroxymethyldihydropteridine diphosphokinase